LRITPSTRILITGASGSLGWTVAALLVGHCKVMAAYCSNAVVPEGTEPVRLDLRDKIEPGRIMERYRPDAIVHLAAITDPDRCEQDPGLAERVNLEATSELAGAAAEQGCTVLFASTDLVFDGSRGDYSEDDAAHPLSTYGETKLRAEQAVLESCCDNFVFRSSLVYGEGSPSSQTFLSKVLDRLDRGEPMQLFTDQSRNPILANDLARAVIAAIEGGISGLYHVGGCDVVTRYEFGQLVCRSFGHREDLLVPVRMQDFAYTARRPLNSTLDITRFGRATGFVPLPLTEALAALARRR
jgi:dTDP-4-dehydrorhamnose reductase